MNSNISIDLKCYIENNIFPLYAKNDEGHGIKHINYVVKRSLKETYSKIWAIAHKLFTEQVLTIDTGFILKGVNK